MGFNHHFSRASMTKTLPGGLESYRLTQIQMPAADYKPHPVMSTGVSETNEAETPP
jgi:hypothetical protein